MSLMSEFTTEFTSGKGIRKRKGREIVKRDLKKTIRDADTGIVTYNLGVAIPISSVSFGGRSPIWLLVRIKPTQIFLLVMISEYERTRFT